MAAVSADSLSGGASLSLCTAHLCHICVRMAEQSHWRCNDGGSMFPQLPQCGGTSISHPSSSKSKILEIKIKYISVSFSSGLAKPMGLVEGPGGLGQGGAPAALGEDSRDTEGKYEEYGYNAQLSDRISLDRSIPDYRPKKYVHLQFWFVALAWRCSPWQGCMVLDSLILSAADWFYFCESTHPEEGLYAKKVSFPSETVFFFPQLCSLLDYSQKVSWRW